MDRIKTHEKGHDLCIARERKEDDRKRVHGAADSMRNMTFIIGGADLLAFSLPQCITKTEDWR